MKRAVLTISALTVATVIAAIVGQALTVSQGIYYDPSGRPVNPSPLATLVTILGVAGLLALPLTAATFALGVIATTLAKRYGWLVALLVASVLTVVGMLGMVWILLSARSPLAFQTPFALIPLVTLAYALLAARRDVTAAGAV